MIIMDFEPKVLHHFIPVFDPVFLVLMMVQERLLISTFLLVRWVDIFLGDQFLQKFIVLIIEQLFFVTSFFTSEGGSLLFTSSIQFLLFEVHILIIWGNIII